MPNANGLIIVWMNVASRYDEELHDWYETEHVGEVAGLVGVHNVQRFYDQSHPLRYMAAFECVDEHVETGPAFQAMVGNATPWTQRIRKLFGEQRLRGNYRKLVDQGEIKPHCVRLVVHSQTEPTGPITDTVEENILRYRAFSLMPSENLFSPKFKYLEIYDVSTVSAAQDLRSRMSENEHSDISIRTPIGSPKFNTSRENEVAKGDLIN